MNELVFAHGILMIIYLSHGKIILKSRSHTQKSIGSRDWTLQHCPTRADIGFLQF